MFTSVRTCAFALTALLLCACGASSSEPSASLAASVPAASAAVAGSRAPLAAGPSVSAQSKPNLATVKFGVLVNRETLR